MENKGYNLLFEITLAPGSQVVKGSDTTKLKYKLKIIQLEYKMIRSESLAADAMSVYSSGKSSCTTARSGIRLSRPGKTRTRG